jgi:hypothetical protein
MDGWGLMKENPIYRREGLISAAPGRPGRMSRPGGLISGIPPHSMYVEMRHILIIALIDITSHSTKTVSRFFSLVHLGSWFFLRWGIGVGNSLTHSIQFNSFR